MGNEHPNTSSGSKSRDTRGIAPSQDDVRDELRNEADEGGDDSNKATSGGSTDKESTGSTRP